MESVIRYKDDSIIPTKKKPQKTFGKDEVRECIGFDNDEEFEVLDLNDFDPPDLTDFELLDLNDSEQLGLSKFFGKKKKRSQNYKRDESNHDDIIKTTDEEEEDYTYDALLTRLYTNLHRDRPDYMNRPDGFRIVLSQPEVLRYGVKWTALCNFMDLTKQMSRPPKHLQKYFISELGVHASIKKKAGVEEDALFVRGRFKQKHFERLLKRYVMSYVLCYSCKSKETQLVREGRFTFLDCQNCLSKKVAPTIRIYNRC